jgi:L-ribulose-5-phosphate 3-epimerase UlaE
MAGPDTSTVVPMEIFIEQDVIAPMRIVLQSIRSAEHRTFPLGILEEDVRQTA